MSFFRSSSLILLLTLLLLLGAAAPALAESWYEHYDRALQAIQDEDWEEAIVQLNLAIEKRGDSGFRVRSYGMNVVNYFPYLKLGIVYYHLGQLETAEQSFATEEGFESIKESPQDQAELQRYRKLVLQAKEERGRREQQRIDEIVQESIDKARSLHEQGRLEEAMEALTRALAVAPDSSEAVAFMDRLRVQVARVARQRQEEALAAEMVQRGEQLLAQGHYSEASSVLRQAQLLHRSPRATQLLEQAQTRLRVTLAARRDAAERRRLISGALQRASELEQAGRFTEAIDELQPVLAVDPDNREALDRQQRLLRAQQEAARQRSVQAVLREAETAFAEGRFEQALMAANQALGLDAGNSVAREYLRRCYPEIGRQLLGGKKRENLPPAIRFTDLREDQPDGSRLQLLREPELRLSGVVLDSSPVSIELYDEEGGRLDGRAQSQPVGEYFLTEFSLDTRLAPGRTTFSVVATDSQQLTARSEYTVYYRRPWFRSPWLPVAAAGLVLLVITGVLVQRERSRRRLRRRRYNPYIAGAPVLEQDLFFGRDQLLDKILQTIHNNSLLLYGERRIGKTSLQHQLKRRLLALDDPEYRFYPVYIDLQGTRQERFFATLAEDIFQELATRLDGIEPHPALQEARGYGYRQLVGDLRAVLKRLAERSDRRVKLVLLIDEVDELNDYDPRINQRLRSLFMKSFAENLVAVVSGVEIRKQWEKEGSPWYNFFEEIEVKAISRADARALIRRPIRGVLKLADARVEERIIELADCKPYLIQKLCIALVNHMYEQNRRTITLADVEAVCG